MTATRFAVSKRAGRITWAAVAAAVLLLLGTPGTAWAHNRLLRSDPADSQAVSAAPRQVTLAVSEGLEARFTDVAVIGPGGGAVTDGAVQVSQATAVQPLHPSLKPGTYTVSFRVVSVDGHPVVGSVTFTVTGTAGLSSSPASGTDPATASTAAAPAAESPPPVARRVSDTGTVRWAIGGAALAAAVAAGVITARRRRRGSGSAS